VIAKDERQAHRVKEFFGGTRAEEYQRAQYRDTATFIGRRAALLARRIADVSADAGRNVLDAGCGPGQLVSDLCARGFQCTAADLSRAMVERGRDTVRERSGAGSARFAVGDVAHLPFEDGVFDVVVCAGVVEYLDEPQHAMRELRRVLRPGGYALVPTTNLWSTATPFTALSDLLRKQGAVRGLINRWWTARGNPPVRERVFRVRRSRPSRFRRLLVEAGFEIERAEYFYLMPLPYPLDRLLPRVAAGVLRLTDALTSTAFRRVSEGYLVMCRRPEEG